MKDNSYGTRITLTVSFDGMLSTWPTFQTPT